MNLADKLKIIRGRVFDKLKYVMYRIVFPFENELFKRCEPAIIKSDMFYLKRFSDAKDVKKNDWLAYLMKVYSENYCPPRITHNALSQKNRERCFWFRLELDKALETAKENINSQQQPWL